MTTSNSPENDDQIQALARDKEQLAKTLQLAEEITAMQAEFQASRAEFLAQAAENSRILDRLEARDRGQP